MTSRRRDSAMVKRMVSSVCLGVIVNLAVAWGLTLWSPNFVVSRIAMGDIVYIESDKFYWEIAAGYQSKHEYYIPMDGRLSYAGPPGTTSGHRYAGWPMLGVYSRVTLSRRPFTATNRSGRATTYYEAIGGWGLPTSELIRRGYPTNHLPAWLRAQPERRLPLVPLWPGFAINTLFYGSLAWVTLFAITRAKQRRRRDRGCCIACAYPVENLETCPECGTTANPRTMVQ